MSIEENKEIVTRFVESFTSRNTDAAIDLLADDATWWVAGHPEEFPLAATLDKAGLKKVVDELLVTMENGLAMRLLNIVAEGDLVAAEVESHGVTPRGRKYTQQYHYLFRMKDGKIQEAKEYLDTLHCQKVFIDP